ncbi:MAG: response regulator transcription factor [Candidatus Eisenbacteria bacterium]
MSKARILVVDDEEDILELIRYNLDREGFQVQTVDSGLEAIHAAETTLPDLIILDLMMPGVDGLQVCSQLRGSPPTADLPIVILTARDDDEDIVRGLQAGADDYMTKPFTPKVLLARVQAVLRRRRREIPDEGAVLTFGALSIHPRRHEARLEDEILKLTAAEFRALHYLARHPGWVFTRQQIVEAVHGEDYVVTDRSIDVLLVGLRKKLSGQADLIETVRGVGYRFKG